jgi:hypothetical protein
MWMTAVHLLETRSDNEREPEMLEFLRAMTLQNPNEASPSSELWDLPR